MQKVNKHTGFSQKGGKLSKSGLVKKTPSKSLSKKKQKALTKSSKVMIEKMNKHTTEDDIMNIIMSVETHTDTKAVEGEEVRGKGDSNAKSNPGLRSLETSKLRADRVRDEQTQKKEAAVQSDIAEQLKLIDSFTL